MVIIERNVFDDFKSLEEFNLFYNNLMSLFYDFFTFLYRLERVYFNYNFWYCNCDVFWLSWWFKETVFSNITCCVRCYAFVGFKGRYIGELD